MQAQFIGPIRVGLPVWDPIRAVWVEGLLLCGLCHQVVSYRYVFRDTIEVLVSLHSKFAKFLSTLGNLGTKEFERYNKIDVHYIFAIIAIAQLLKITCLCKSHYLKNCRSDLVLFFPYAILQTTANHCHVC